MNEKKMTYKINSKSGSEYGYLHFNKEDIGEAVEFFPENEFEVEMEGKTVRDRKLNTKRRRVNLYPLRDKFNIDDTLILKRKNEDLIKITKK